VPIEARNNVENLLQLCPTCHDLIDKNNGRAYPADELARLKSEHEAWTATLRQAGRPWRMSYASIDYVNAPRVAMLAGGDAISHLAHRAGLDPTRPFAGQGFAPGVFVGALSPFFESWREKAVPLDEANLDLIQEGMYVTFSAFMRSRNVPSLPWTRGLSGDWRRDPYLSFSLSGRAVAVRYDPDWLTTGTAAADLGSAETESISYAGFGLVVGVTADAIMVSAHVFGKPETPEGMYVKHVFLSGQKNTESLHVSDFEVESPVVARMERPGHAGKRAGGEVSIALHFNELEVDPGQIERETFKQLMRIVPEFRRDLVVAVASLITSSVYREMPGPAGIASGLLAGSPRVWSTHSIDGLGNLLRTTDMAYAVVRGLRREQLADFHQELLDNSSSYLGMIEVNLKRPMHLQLYAAVPRYRIVEADLRLLYSAMEYSEEFGDWDHRPTEMIAEWEAEEFFRDVSWEEDKDQSADDMREAEHEVGTLLRGMTEGNFLSGDG
jgi:hypothetical protein